MKPNAPKSRKRRSPEHTCPKCGGWKVADFELCHNCARREPSIRDVQFSRDPLPRSHPEQSDREQEQVSEELSRCAECGTPFMGHTLDCSATAFVDLAEEFDPYEGAEAIGE